MSDRYRVVRQVEVGGMAEILEAFVRGDGGFERRVAIKRLQRSFVGDRAVERAFFDEARVLSQLSHPNIVQIFDYGTLDGRPFQVLEFVDGMNVFDLVDRSQRAGVDMTTEVALHMTSEVARALEYIHDATDPNGERLRIVHRDVGPRNILVSERGEVKLADFGVAHAAIRSEATAVGETKGTLFYMAPEQSRGAQVDGRTDVYALGLVLHFLITGHSPLEDAEQRLHAFAGAKLSLDSRLPSEVARIVERATRYEPRARFENARQMADACWSSLSSRTTEDARRLLANWVHRHTRERRRPKAHAVGDLFDFRLIDPSSDDNPVRRFSSVARPEMAIEGDVKPAIEVFRDEAGTIPSGLLPADVDDPSQRLDKTVTVPTHQSKSNDARIGSNLYGYRIVERLEQRSAWTRYAAHHEIRDREFEVVVFESAALRPDGFERLRNAAQAAARLAGRRTVGALECDRASDGAPFIVHDRLPGRTLRDVIELEAPLPTARAARIARGIAEALVVIHGAKLVHGTLDPRAIRVEEVRGEERIVLADVGLLDALTESARSTIADIEYHAPEKLQEGADATLVDLYALGVIMYELVAERPPFIDRLTEPRRLTSVGSYSPIVDGLLKKHPRERTKTARAVVDSLHPLAVDLMPTGESTRTLTPVDPATTDQTKVGTAPVPTVITGPRPRNVATWMVAALAIVGICLAIVYFNRRATRVIVPRIPAPVSAIERPQVERAPPVAAQPPSPVVVKEEPARKVRRIRPPARPKSAAPPPEAAPAVPSVVELKRDLEHIFTLISASQNRMNDEQFERLESRYFDLRLALRPGLDETSRGRLATRVRELGRDVRNAP